jgi:hypothetical protein
MTSLTQQIQAGFPVILQAGTVAGFPKYVCVNGYDSATQMFKIVYGGVQSTISASSLNSLWGSTGYSYIVRSKVG